MKAYKLILNLLKHPFAEVKLLLGYNLTHVRYNSCCKEYLLESITDKYNGSEDSIASKKKFLGCDHCLHESGKCNPDNGEFCPEGEEKIAEIEGISSDLGIKIALLDCCTCVDFNKKCKPFKREFNPVCEKYFNKKPKDWEYDPGEKEDKESTAEALKKVADILRKTPINERNKALYDKAFVSWRDIPMIDRSNVEDWTQSKEGNYIPATAIGERDYMEAHLEGLQNIFKSSFKVPFFLLEMLNSWTLDSCPVKLYDNIHIGDKDVIVTKITNKEILFSDRKGNLYSHDWKNEQTN